LSPVPTIVLHDIRIANPPWASRADFARAESVEVTIALFPLLRGHVEIPRIVFEGVDVLLEQRPSNDVNWTFHPQHSSITGSEAMGSPATAVEIPTIELHRGTVGYHMQADEGVEQALVADAKLETVPDRNLRLTLNGEYRRVPVTIAATGGTLVGLTAGREPWPIAVEVRTGDATATVQGTVGAPIGAPTLDFHVELIGDSLNGLNQLLVVEWPGLGPYSLSGRVRLESGVFSVTDLRAKIGSSDLAGEGSVDISGGRAKLIVKLISERIALDDFLERQVPAQRQASTVFLDQGVAIPDLLKSWDVSINVAAENILLREYALQTVGLRAVLQNGVLRIDLSNARAFGLPLRGHAEANIGAEVPSVSMTLAAERFDSGLALSALGVPEGLAGMSDVAVSATSQGTTWRDIIRSLAVTVRLEQSRFLLNDPISGDLTELSISPARASVRASESGHVVLAGRYGNRPFHLDLTMGPITRLVSDESWTFRLALRGAAGHLMIAGLVREPLHGRGLALTLSGEGQNLATLFPSVPALGPYRVSSGITGEIQHFRLTDFKWMLSNSDITGQIDVALMEDRPVVTAQLSSRLIRAEDWFAGMKRSEVSAAMPPERDDAALSRALHAFDANIDWHVDRFTIGDASLRALSLAMKLHQGQFMTSFGTTVAPRGELKGDLVLDARGEMPILKTSARLRGLDYGDVLRRIAGIDGITGSGDLDLSLHSRGHSMEALFEQLVGRLTARPGTMHFALASGKDFGPVTIAEATLDLPAEKPVMLSLHGEVRGVPLSFTMTGITFRKLSEMPFQLPLKLVIQGPYAVLEAQGQVGFRIARWTADFHVRLTDESVGGLAPLFESTMPDIGPYELTGEVTIGSHKIGLFDFHARSGGSDVSGRVDLSWKESRPKIRGVFASDLIEFHLPEPQAGPASATQETEESHGQATSRRAKETAATAKSIGEATVEFLDPLQRNRSIQSEERLRLIPDWTLPVQSLHSADLDLQWTVKRLSMSPIHLDDVIAVLTLNDGLLTAGPILFNHEGAVTTGLLTCDATHELPRVAIDIATTGLDYGGLFKAFGVEHKVEGHVDVTFSSQGTGYSLRELAAGANGRLEIVAGPSRVAARYVELWATNLMSTMLSQLWHKEEDTRYNCAAGSFDIRDGEMQTNGLLVDATDYSVAMAGAVALNTEELDMVATPKPKDLVLLNPAVPIRLTGPLASPHVSSNASSIADSKAWQILDVADPIGVVLRVPRIVLRDEHHAMDNSGVNPCLAALKKSDKGRLPTVKAVQRGFTWMTDLWRDAVSTGDRHPVEESTGPVR
jgi:uncharacterized protein involved in outer membrane biogenesis